MWLSQERQTGLCLGTLIVVFPVLQAYVIAPGALATPRTYYNTYAPKQSTSPRGSTLGQSLPSPHSHSRRRFSRCTIAMPPSQQRRNSNGASDPKSVAIPPASPQALLRAHAGVSPTVTHASPDKLKLDPLQEELPSGMESTLVTGGLDEEQTDPVPTGVSEAAGIASQTQKNSVGVGPVRRGSMLDNVPVQTVSGDGCYTAVLIVPTGIGAAIGGYAGDALPVARVMSSVVDNLVTHPNVMNGAVLYWPEPGMQYVEGYALDEFCAGRWGLLPVKKGGHRIGLVLDSDIEEDLLLRHVQAANAARATLGINVAEYCVTEQPAGVTLEMTKSGASWGTVKGLGSLVAAGRRLVEEAGCTAIAVVARFPDDEDEEALQAYREGSGVDAVGGAEAIISHVMSQELKVPCAHAPALPPIDVDESVSPRACAEELGYTFLPCVLANLHRAPSLITSRQHARAAEALWADAVDAVVAPATAFGGAGALSLAEQATTLLVAVEDNITVMKAGAKDVLRCHSSSGRCVTVSSYLEAVGVLAAHKAGVNPACLTVDVPAVRKLPSGSFGSLENNGSGKRANVNNVPGVHCEHMP